MIPFENKDYDTLFTEVIGYAQEHEIISTNVDFPALIRENKDIENFTVLLLSIISKLYDEVYDDMADVKKGYNILEATGSDLDNLGVFKGISRPQATSCCATLVFTLVKPAPATITLESPIVVSTSDGIQYKTITTGSVIEVGSTEFKLESYAVNAGLNQRVSDHTLTTLVSGLPDDLGKCTVTNPEASTGGSETATDSEYREYLLNSDKIHEKGTRWSYVNYLNRYNGLDSYNLVPQWDGTGTIKVIVDINDSTEYHINQILAGIKENCSWADDDVQVIPADKVDLSLNLVANISIDQATTASALVKSETEAKLRKAILTYINGGIRANGKVYKGLVIGEDFIPYKLGRFIGEEISTIQDLSFQNPTTPTVIRDNEIGSISSEDIIISME